VALGAADRVLVAGGSSGNSNTENFGIARLRTDLIFTNGFE
jgi:hypothetical protein